MQQSEDSEVPMIPTTINGKWELLLPEHRAVRPEWKTGWEVARLDSMHANIRPGDVVYDIGTEEGDLSALWASWASPPVRLLGHAEGLPEIAEWIEDDPGGGGVCLFEPNPLVWPNIRSIFNANNLNHTVLGWVVGFASDETNIDPPENAYRDDTVIDGWPECAFGPIIGDHGFRQLNERPHDTPQVRIDEYAEDNDLIPTVITLDVEGSEYRVLRGAERILRSHHPLVYASVHPSFMSVQYDTPSYMLHEFMVDCGYKVEFLGTDHEQHWSYWHPSRPLIQP